MSKEMFSSFCVFWIWVLLFIAVDVAWVRYIFAFAMGVNFELFVISWRIHRGEKWSL